MLTCWQAVVLGLVEGITEYLPVSSTGHLILTSSLLRLNQPETKDALDAYLVVVQGGAILAVLGLYRSRVAQMVRSDRTLYAQLREIIAREERDSIESGA